MPTDSQNRALRYSKRLLIISLCLHTACYAAGLRNTQLDAQSRTVSLQAQSITDSEVAPASASGEARLADEAPAATPMTSLDDAIINKNLPAKNPYEALVKLAFKGKGADGVDSYTEAAALYCKSARDQNDANAEFALGWLYTQGRGVEKDANIAAMFFKKAALQGHVKAQEWLGRISADPELAKIPECLLPDPPPTTTAFNASGVGDSTEAVIKPFYSKGPIYQLVAKIAPRYKIDADLAMAFIAVESGYNPKATSPKNAQGLMQLIPETAARFKVKNAYDPEQNINGGLAYLQWLLAYFEGNVPLVAAAYNAGENTVDKYSGIPPYPETRQYVKKITSLYTRKFHPYRNDLMPNKSAILSKWAQVR